MQYSILDCCKAVNVLFLFSHLSAFTKRNTKPFSCFFFPDKKKSSRKNITTNEKETRIFQRKRTTKEESKKRFLVCYSYFLRFW